MSKLTQLDFAGQPIYVGIDVHLRSWEVSIHTATLEHKTFRQPPEAQVLGRYLQRHFPGARYQAVYEAGLCGFTVSRQLRALGIACIVVHPADVPTTDKERRRKTDRVDARKLAKDLRAGQLTPLYMPPRWAEADRALVRLRATLITDQTRLKNRLKSLLRVWGLPVPGGRGRSLWSQAGLEAVGALALDSPVAQQVLQQLVEQLQTLRARIQTVTRQIRALAQTPRYQKRVTLLTSIPGLGVLSAMTWLTELVCLDRFPSFDHLCSYVGLVPGEHSTGTDPTPTGLDRRGNPRLRTLLIQNSWVAVRKDPALLQAWHRWTPRMPKQQAIIRVARKLLRRLRHVLQAQEPYSTGVVE